MSIANQTTAEVYALSGTMGNTLKALMNYRSDSRNPAMVAATNTALAALKPQLDAAIADVTAVTPVENPPV